MWGERVRAYVAMSSPGGSTDNIPAGTRLPVHNPEVLAASLSRAREFYRYDSQLTSPDRQKLASFFWQRLTIFPLLGMPVVIGFIMTPNILRKRGYLNAKKRHRLLQVGLGFIGLGVGFQFGGLLATKVHTSRLGENEAAKRSYLSLSYYPPQLGAKYYALTAQFPELSFKDPEHIDWKRSPVFPVCLILNQDVIQHFRNEGSSRMNRRVEKLNGFAGGSPGSGDGSVNGAASGAASGSANGPSYQSKDVPLTGTSWDNIIKNNQNTEQQVSPGSSTSVPPAQFPPLPSSQPSLQQYNSYSDISEEQRKFDELLEKERQEALKDSFEDSEKRW